MKRTASQLAWVVAVVGAVAVPLLDAASARGDEPAPPAPAVAEPTPEALEFFEKQVRPLLVQHCQSCHGPNGHGGAQGSAITNDAFLALASDQYLRTIVIAGRPELGAPDWRGYTAGRPMSEQEVTDVVSWLASHRVATPGQPYLAER